MGSSPVFIFAALGLAMSIVAMSNSSGGIRKEKETLRAEVQELLARIERLESLLVEHERSRPWRELENEPRPGNTDAKTRSGLEENGA